MASNFDASSSASVKKRDREPWNSFLACLRSEGFSHTATLIHEHLYSLYFSTRDYDRTQQIKSGLVPTQPQYYVSRTQLIYKIKDAVIAATERAQESGGTQWILMHGMPGNGKSYLGRGGGGQPRDSLDWSIYWFIGHQMDE